MSDATSESMSPELVKVVERAKAEPEGRVHSLAHLIDVPALTRAYRRMRKDAAAGVDGVTKEKYGRNLEANLQDLPGTGTPADATGSHHSGDPRTRSVAAESFAVQHGAAAWAAGQRTNSSQSPKPNAPLITAPS